MTPEEVKALKVGDILEFRAGFGAVAKCHQRWKVMSIGDRFVNLQSTIDEDWTWELFKSPTHPQWKGFTKVEKNEKTE